MKARRSFPGALSAAAVLLAACSGSAVGPLGDGGGSGRLCFPGTKGHTVTMGYYALQNNGTAAVKILSIKLPSQHGFRVTRSWLVPIRDRMLIGAGFPWPPTSPDWALRRPASGAIIQARETLNLVFGLTRTSDTPGRSTGPVVVYTVNDTTYTMQEHTSFEEAMRCT